MPYTTSRLGRSLSLGLASALAIPTLALAQPKGPNPVVQYLGAGVCALMFTPAILSGASLAAETRVAQDFYPIIPPPTQPYTTPNNPGLEPDVENNWDERNDRRYNTDTDTDSSSYNNSTESVPENTPDTDTSTERESLDQSFQPTNKTFAIIKCSDLKS